MCWWWIPGSLSPTHPKTKEEPGDEASEPSERRVHFTVFLITYIVVYFFTSYSRSCQKLLLSVCQELMLPHPIEFAGSPTSSLHDICVHIYPNSCSSSGTGRLHSPCDASTTASSIRRLADFICVPIKILWNALLTIFTIEDKCNIWTCEQVFVCIVNCLFSISLV